MIQFNSIIGKLIKVGRIDKVYSLKKLVEAAEQEEFFSELDELTHKEEGKGEEEREEDSKLDLKRNPQLPLPMHDNVPDIRFLPVPEEFEAQKNKQLSEEEPINQKWEDAKNEYVKEWGREPNSWQLTNWWKDNHQESLKIPYETDRNRYGIEPKKLEDMTLDIDVPPVHYKELEAELLRTYKEVEEVRQQLIALVENAKLSAMEKPVEPNPEGMSLADMVKDVQYRLKYHTEQVFLNAVGLSVLGIAHGGRSGYPDAHDLVQSFLSEIERDWYDNPASILQFMETPPTIADREVTWNTKLNQNHGLRQENVRRQLRQTPESWMEEKKKILYQYKNSLINTIDSFKKSMKFVKGFDRKVAKRVAENIDSMSKKNLKFFNTDYKDVLDKNYLEAVERLDENERDVALSIHYEGQSAQRYKTLELNPNIEMSLFDIAYLVLNNTTQKHVYDLFINFVAELYNNTIKDVNTSIVEPSINKISKVIVEEVVLLATGKSIQELNTGLTSIENSETLEIADRWLDFTKGGPKNYQSVIMYPKFMIDDKELSSIITEGMKFRLGVSVKNTFSSSDKIRRLEAEVSAWMRNQHQKKLNISKGRTQGEWEEDALTKKQPFIDKLIAWVKDMSVLGERGEETDYNWHEEGVAGNEQISIPARYKELGEALDERLQNNNVKEHSDEPIGALIIRKVLYTTSPRIQSISFSQIIDHVWILSNMINEPIIKLNSELSEGGKTPTLPDRVRASGKEVIQEIKYTESLLDWLQNVQPIDLPDYESEQDANEKERKLNLYYNAKFQNDNLTRFKIEMPSLFNQVKALVLESKLPYVYRDRLESFGGTGPRALGKNVEAEFSKNPIFEGLPIKQFFTLLNKEATEKIQGEELDNALSSHNYTSTYAPQDILRSVLEDWRRFPSIYGHGAKEYTLVALAKHLGIKDGHQMFRMWKDMDDINFPFATANIGKDEIDNWLPFFVKGNKKYHKSLLAALNFAHWDHNNGLNLTIGFKRKLAGNPNMKSWGTGNSTVDNYFEIITTLKEKGGYNGLVKESPDLLKRLLDQKIIRRGFKKRIVDLTRVFKNQVKLNPHMENYEGYKSMISEVAADVKSLSESNLYSELNQEVGVKSKELFKLDWAPKDQNFRFRVLKSFDPYALKVGADTNCCQSMGGVGEDAAKDSYVNPLAGVLILEFKIEGTWSTVSQSYFHWVPRDSIFILDNIESNSKLDKDAIRLTDRSPTMLYALLAERVMKDKNVDDIILGSRFTKIDTSEFKKRKVGDNRSFNYRYSYNGTTDWTPGNGVSLGTPKFNLPITSNEKKALQTLFRLVRTNDLRKEVESIQEALGV